MQAGKLRYLVTIESPTTTQDAASGEPVTTWDTFATVHASKEDLTGREAFLAMQVLRQQQTRWTVRYLDGVDERMRLTHDGVRYNIQSIADPDGRKRTLVILASKES